MQTLYYCINNYNEDTKGADASVDLKVHIQI